MLKKLEHFIEIAILDSKVWSTSRTTRRIHPHTAHLGASGHGVAYAVDGSGIGVAVGLHDPSKGPVAAAWLQRLLPDHPVAGRREQRTRCHLHRRPFVLPGLPTRRSTVHGRLPPPGRRVMRDISTNDLPSLMEGEICVPPKKNYQLANPSVMVPRD